MPQTYYAATTPIKSGTIQTVKSSDFQNTFTDKRNLIRYHYNDLIRIINEDPNLKLFTSEAEAKAYGSEKEAIEDKEKKPNGFSAVDLALSIFMPHYVALRTVSFIADAVLPPGKVRNLYQSIVLKITVRDENSILPDDSNTPGCVGVLPPRQFNLVANKSTQASSLSFSISNSYYLHTLHFRKDHRYTISISGQYPKKYRKVTDDGDVNVATNLLKDYYAPKLGLFLKGHWNRHHTADAEVLYKQIQSLDRAAALKVLWAKRNALYTSNQCNLEGSFFKRISYAIEVLTPKEPTVQNRL